VDDRRRTPFATFAAGCDRRCPALVNRGATELGKQGSMLNAN